MTSNVLINLLIKLQQIYILRWSESTPQIPEDAATCRYSQRNTVIEAICLATLLTLCSVSQNKARVSYGARTL